MLPVASPQHAADAYYSREEHLGPAAYTDPMTAALYAEGGYPDMHTADQQQQQQPGIDLESIKYQKILEFREALEHEMERKRQQAQKELEDAERRQWQQYLEFQQALQGETQQYMAQSPMSAMEQHRMSIAPGSALPQQHGMARPTSPMRQPRSMAASYNAIQHQQQQQQARMARAASPMRSTHGSATVASSITQHSLGLSSQSTVHQYNNMMRSQSPMGSRVPPSSPYHQQSPLSSARIPTNGHPSSSSPAMGPPPLPIPVETTPGDRWESQQQHINAFTFDNVGNDRRSNAGASPASYHNSTSYHQTPTGGEFIPMSSTWAASSPRSPSLNNHGLDGRQAPPSTPSGNPPVRHQRYTQADELEQEYARLTGKESHRETALKNVKKLQEERRKKLEALTARVVENRRRFAREVKSADRPREISFVDSREDHHTMDIDNALSAIPEKKKGGVKTAMRGGEQESSVKDQSNYVPETGLFSDEDYSNEREVSSREDETRDFFSVTQEGRSNDPATKKTS